VYRTCTASVAVEGELSDISGVRSDELEAAQKRTLELEAQVAQLQEQLAESQRLATIGTISAVVAHEFNNLLTPVVSYAQYALKSVREPSPDLAFIEKALVKAAAGGEKAGKICASMLNLARGESGAYGPVELNHVVQEVLSILAREPSKDGIALRVQVPGGLKVVGDPIQLEQVLLNLLINARQAMLGRGGKLTVRAEVEAASECGVLYVSDTGAGIAEEHMERIWEPFFTTKRGRPGGGGTGLGLAIVKEIVEKHRGSIGVESSPGQGTCFTVKLPLAA
jgi:signal transduction histidine kinase